MKHSVSDELGAQQTAKVHVGSDQPDIPKLGISQARIPIAVILAELTPFPNPQSPCSKLGAAARILLPSLRSH